MRRIALAAAFLLCSTACLEPDEPDGPGDELAGDELAGDELASDEAPPAPGDAPGAIPLLVGTDNPFGTLSGAAYANTWQWNTNGQNVWRTIPQLSTVAYARAGDQLEVDVSADINSNSSAPVSLRVLVDGVVAAPNDVVFRSGGASRVRSFRFVQSNLTAGRHIVEVQWRGDPGATITDHQVSARTAAPSWGEGRLITTWLADSLSTTTSTAWNDLNGMWLLSYNDVPRDLVITGSFEAESTSGYVRVRPLVDGVPVGDTYLLPPNAARGARSFVYHVSNVAAGLHSVSFQWAVDGGTARIWDRSLTVYSGPWLGSRGGISGQTTYASTTLSTSTWTPLTEHTVYTYASTEISTITLSTEAYTTYGGELYARVLVDGLPAQPGDVLVTQQSGGYQAHTLTFMIRNLAPGAHQFRVEVMVAGSSSRRRAYIRDRNLAIIHNQRHGVDFASTPLVGQQPRQGTYNVVAICFDPQSPIGGPVAPFAPGELMQTLVGWDGHKNVYDWFVEASGGQLQVTPLAVVGCYQPPCPTGNLEDESCHRNGWYWRNWIPGAPWDQQPQSHKDDILQMQQDAIAAADADLHFHGYDTNGDNTISPTEALIVVAKPQGSLFGQWTGGTFTVDGSAMHVPFIDAYLEPDDADASNERTRRVGLLAHELSHAILGADDLYGSSAGSNPYSIMSMISWAQHLDPAHKLANGMVTPTAIEMETWSTAAVTLPDVESSGELLLLYSRNRPFDVFLVENRWVDSSNQDGFEIENAGGAGPQSGIVVWRVGLWNLGWSGVTNRLIRNIAPSSEQGVNRLCLKYTDGITAPVAIERGASPNGDAVTISLVRMTNPSACQDVDNDGGLGGLGGLGR